MIDQEITMPLNPMDPPSAAEIARHFSAAMDSVNLIVELNKKENLSETDKNTIERNKEHLRIMIKRNWFDEEQNAALSSVL